MRAFRRISNQRWLSRLDNTSRSDPSGNPLPIPPPDLAQISAAYGIPANDIEIVETPTDPRVNPIMLPARAPAPEEIERTRLDLLANKVGLTAAERDELLQTLAKRTLRGRVG